MKRSTDRILTTHVGSLPRPADLLAVVRAKEEGKPIDEKAHAARLRQDYEPVGLVSAAPMSGDWFHQHFGIGKEGLRITAWHGPNNQRSRKPGRPGEQLLDYGAIDLSKGGSAIPYHQEDPAIRTEFEAALAREGVASRMNAEFYQRPPAAGEVVMGDVM